MVVSKILESSFSISCFHDQCSFVIFLQNSSAASFDFFLGLLLSSGNRHASYQNRFDDQRVRLNYKLLAKRYKRFTTVVCQPVQNR